MNIKLSDSHLGLDPLSTNTNHCKDHNMFQVRNMQTLPGSQTTAKKNDSKDFTFIIPLHSFDNQYICIIIKGSCTHTHTYARTHAHTTYNIQHTHASTHTPVLSCCSAAVIRSRSPIRQQAHHEISLSSTSFLVCIYGLPTHLCS